MPRREATTWSLAIHGGAGLIRPHSLSPEREAAARAGLNAALDAGAQILAADGSALDAVQAAIVALEECPEFNAGHGSVLDRDGRASMDAALIDGDRHVGAVAGVRTPRNPIRLARAVMDCTQHVLIVGVGADRLATKLELEQMEPAWFVVPARAAQLERVRKTGAVVLDHDDPTGTVGAVAKDVHGRVAAGNSTGGMVNKWPGRVGDAPLPHAGTFAWNQTCAVAATGHGEPFVELGAAGRVSSWMELGGLDLATAAERVIHQELPDESGGLVAVDGTGRVVMTFSSAGMYRGSIDATGSRAVAIWRDL